MELAVIKKRLRGCKGFTLLELMIALVILAIGLMGVSGMILTSVRGNAFGSRMMQATALAQDKIEEMQNSRYKSLYADCRMAGFPITCPNPPGTMPLDADGLVQVSANDSGANGDEISGDGVWTYQYDNATGPEPLPAGMTLIWGVKRNYPQPRLVWIMAAAQWKEKLKTHEVRVESIIGNF